MSEGNSGPGRVRDITRPAGDPYVRENYAALAAVEMTNGQAHNLDKRIGAALARRGLVFEQPADCWHLTQDGSRVLAALYRERSRHL